MFAGVRNGSALKFKTSKTCPLHSLLRLYFRHTIFEFLCVIQTENLKYSIWLFIYRCIYRIFDDDDEDEDGDEGDDEDDDVDKKQRLRVLHLNWHSPSAR